MKGTTLKVLRAALISKKGTYPYFLTLGRFTQGMFESMLAQAAAPVVDEEPLEEQDDEEDLATSQP
jgi:hypothetical protein